MKGRPKIGARVRHARASRTGSLFVVMRGRRRAAMLPADAGARLLPEWVGVVEAVEPGAIRVAWKRGRTRIVGWHSAYELALTGPR